MTEKTRRDYHKLVGRCFGHIEHLRRENGRLQAKIDALMLEYCPEEMTPEQIATWGEHQAPASTGDVPKGSTCGCIGMCARELGRSYLGRCIIPQKEEAEI